MITTGVVRAVNITSSLNNTNNIKGDYGDAYIYSVEIPIFRTPGNLDSATYTMNCTASVSGGIYACYNVDDKVYVSFIDNSLSSPVIIGKILTTTGDSRGYGNFDSISVNGQVTLSDNVKMGELTYADLYAMYQKSLIVNGGADGKTPYIGTNGHWWIGDTDTGVTAKGDSALTYITILNTNRCSCYMHTSHYYSSAENLAKAFVANRLTSSSNFFPLSTTNSEVDFIGLYTETDKGDSWKLLDRNLNEADATTTGFTASVLLDI